MGDEITPRTRATSTIQDAWRDKVNREVKSLEDEEAALLAQLEAQLTVAAQVYCSDQFHAARAWIVIPIE